VPNRWSVSCCPKIGCEYETLTAIEAAAIADADLIMVHFPVGNGCDRVKEHLVLLAFNEISLQNLYTFVVGKGSFLVVFHEKN
jgi:hypothetical protein